MICFCTLYATLCSIIYTQLANIINLQFLQTSSFCKCCYEVHDHLQFWYQLERPEERGYCRPKCLPPGLTVHTLWTGRSLGTCWGVWHSTNQLHQLLSLPLSSYFLQQILTTLMNWCSFLSQCTFIKSVFRYCACVSIRAIIRGWGWCSSAWQEVNKMKRVAVIGAGAAGLCCARHLSRFPETFQFTVYEQSDQVGGTWVYSNPSPGNLPRDMRDITKTCVHSSIYKNLR